MRRARWTDQNAASSETVLGGTHTAILSPGAAAIQQWILETFPDPRGISLRQASEVFGIPLKTLYNMAHYAQETGAPIILENSRRFSINPQRFAEWLYAEAGNGQYWSGKYAGQPRREVRS
ncbi:MAG: hypothetical protein OWQ57_08000 [Sulfobacillus sp.]|nr:hypothetical protein [Sulfobacillus sp.]